VRDYLKFYIDGAWVDPAQPRQLDVINPATEEVVGHISMGSAEDVNRAVVAARRAFNSFGRSSKAERLELLDAIIAAYQARSQDMADATREEMGAPAWLATGAHVPFALMHFTTARKLLEDFDPDVSMGSTKLTKEPIGVVGMITPCWGGRLPTASQCARVSALQDSIKGAARGANYPHRHGYVKERFSTAWRRCSGEASAAQEVDAPRDDSVFRKAATHPRRYRGMRQFTSLGSSSRIARA